MATLEEVLDGIDLPVPLEGGEELMSYARRVAYVGAHAALAWAAVHRPVAVQRVLVPDEVREEGPQEGGGPGVDEAHDGQ